MMMMCGTEWMEALMINIMLDEGELYLGSGYTRLHIVFYYFCTTVIICLHLFTF